MSEDGRTVLECALGIGLMLSVLLIAILTWSGPIERGHWVQLPNGWSVLVRP